MAGRAKPSPLLAVEGGVPAPAPIYRAAPLLGALAVFAASVVWVGLVVLFGADPWMFPFSVAGALALPGTRALDRGDPARGARHPGVVAGPRGRQLLARSDGHRDDRRRVGRAVDGARHPQSVGRARSRLGHRHRRGPRPAGAGRAARRGQGRSAQGHRHHAGAGARRRHRRADHRARVGAAAAPAPPSCGRG